LEDADFDEETFSQSFAELKRQGKARRASLLGSHTGTSTNKGKNAAARVSLMSDKREENISIMLKRLRKSPEAMYKAILEMDDSVISLESLPQIKRMVPTEEEHKAVASYEGIAAVLSLASRLLYELCRIPNLSERLNHCEIRLRFDQTTINIVTSAELIHTASLMLRSNQRIKEVLRVVLTLGNYLNAGTKRGNAYGFRLEVLARLSATKTPSDKNITLLHHVAEVVNSYSPESHHFIDDFKPLIQAAELDTEHIISELLKLKKEMKSLQAKVDQLNQVRSKLLISKADQKKLSRMEMISEAELERRLKLAEFDEDRFREVMEDFVNEGLPKLAHVETKWASALDEASAARKFYADDESATLKEFFGAWSEFTDSYARALAQVKIRQVEAAKEKEDAARKAAIVRAKRNSMENSVSAIESSLEMPSKKKAPLLRRRASRRAGEAKLDESNARRRK